MHKYLILSLCVASMMFSYSCQVSKNQSNKTAVVSDSVNAPIAGDTALIMLLSPQHSLHLQESIPLHFTVFNPTNDTLRFTKYHTPFEGFMNNFLTITQADGQEVSYIGPMAKRVMPPVPESYLTVPPNDSLSVNLDLKKGYRFEKKGAYSIEYNGGNVSGITAGKPINVTIEE